MYIIQESRGGEHWKDMEEAGEYFTYLTLEEAVQDVKDFDTYGGKYAFRVVDEQGVVYYHRVDPYEGVSIDLTSVYWLENIRRDYSAPNDVWERACKYWLETYAEE